jgi:predicted nucleic acid-binding Zn ribbon protein
MDDLEILGADLAQVESEGPFDLVTVAVRASAKDCRVRLADGSKIRGTEVPEEFVEYWSFLRRAGRARKAAATGLIEGNCPNCGAAVEMNQGANCAYCRAALRSGEFDWVLAEITQAVEWQGTPRDAVAGVPAMSAKDPGFSLQHLEDRTSVMFWRWAMSQRQGSVRPLRKIASPAFCDVFLERSKASVASDGTRRWVGERAVGSVETLGLATSDGKDHAVVEVRWQGTGFSAKASGPAERGEKGTISHTLFALERREDARSDVGASVSSAHCPNCGAPEAGGETDACEHCGEVMNDGRRDWVLAEVTSRYAPEAREVLARLEAAATASVGSSDVSTASAAAAAAARPLRREAVAWLVRVTVADSEVDAKEREALAAVAEKAGLRQADLDAMIAAASGPTPTDGAAAGPASAVEAREWLDLTAEVALADGRLSAEEASLLSDLGAAHGIPAAEVRLSVAHARARLYQRAKAALRAS